MLLNRPPFLVIALLTLTACANLLSCEEFIFPITATARNRAVRESAGGLAESAPTHRTQGPQQPEYVNVTAEVGISLRYCKPPTLIPSRESTIQLLVHGITYNKNYWSALRPPAALPGPMDRYSWVRYAAEHGYATISIDRMGNGLSSRPDPYTVDQLAMHVSIIHKLVRALRTGTLLGRPFAKVVYVGHSFGSVIGYNLVAIHPETVDALFLTGFSIPDISTSDLVPVSRLTLGRYSGLSDGYLVSSSPAGRRASFFGSNGTFDPEIARMDFEMQDTVAAGEFLIGNTAPPVNYAGPVAVMSGSNSEEPRASRTMFSNMLGTLSIFITQLLKPIGLLASGYSYTDSRLIRKCQA
ncbi:hypothetical protein IFM46972_10654 [Aspergillus udagawae]|uniref:AB hydrolase-1 domain-containing protein n=1 Tax=Aspergillus udagawae TaxID=91492 RepID=A0A8H3XQ27_9EURO|nr:hypothetical protein IFM46972_10654 [Aspergillus udagawae]